MKTLAKIFSLTAVILLLGACGRMGELESVKPQTQELDKQTTQQVVPAPEMEIMPHKSK